MNFVRKRFPRTVAFLELTQHSTEIARFFARDMTEFVVSMSIEEFIALLRLNKTKAAMKLFAICDQDGSGALDFRELLFTLWHVCTVDDRGLIYIVFDLYDRNADGLMDKRDVTELMIDSYGDEIAKSPEVQRILEPLKGGRQVNHLGFWELTRSSPMMLMQIVDMQVRTRKAFLGERLWADMTRRRAAKLDRAYLPENWAELYSKIVILDLQSGGGLKRQPGAADGDGEGGDDGEEEDAGADADVQRAPAPADSGPGDIEIHRAQPGSLPSPVRTIKLQRVPNASPSPMQKRAAAEKAAAAAAAEAAAAEAAAAVAAAAAAATAAAEEAETAAAATAAATPVRPSSDATNGPAATPAGIEHSDDGATHEASKTSKKKKKDASTKKKKSSKKSAKVEIAEEDEDADADFAADQDSSRMFDVEHLADRGANAFEDERSDALADFVDEDTLEQLEAAEERQVKMEKKEERRHQKLKSSDKPKREKARYNVVE